MTHYVIREEPNEEGHHVLLPRFERPKRRPAGARLELLRLMLLGRRVTVAPPPGVEVRPTVTVVDPKGASHEWKISALAGSGKTHQLEFAPRILGRAGAKAWAMLAQTEVDPCPDCGAGMVVTRAHGDDGQPLGGRLLASCAPCSLQVALTDESDQ